MSHSTEQQTRCCFQSVMGWLTGSKILRVTGSKILRASPTLALALAALFMMTPRSTLADEGGVSVWLTGQFGSLAAVPLQPGLSIAITYYHTSLSAGGNVAAARQATIGKFSRTVNINLNASLNAPADLVFLDPTYAFASPVLGGQLALSLGGAFGRDSASINGTLTASVGPLTSTRTGSISDARDGIADLYPQATLRWNSGANNFMTYVIGVIPSGTYDSSRLANFGIGHSAVDSGAGYTYFNPQTGHEFSVVTGFTYNLQNPSTDYQNGIDWHLDWGLSQFFSTQFHVGAVGYFYDQLTGDRGAPLILGANKSRIAGVGPQVGYLFPIGGMQGEVNLKAYWEFDAARRAEGWNTWVTFTISPAAPEEKPPARVRIFAK